MTHFRSLDTFQAKDCESTSHGTLPQQSHRHRPPPPHLPPLSISHSTSPLTATHCIPSSKFFCSIICIDTLHSPSPYEYPLRAQHSTKEPAVQTAPAYPPLIIRVAAKSSSKSEATVGDLSHECDPICQEHHHHLSPFPSPFISPLLSSHAHKKGTSTVSLSLSLALKCQCNICNARKSTSTPTQAAQNKKPLNRPNMRRS